MTNLLSRNRSAILYFGGNFIGKSILFLVPLGFASIVSVASYGSYALSMTIVNFFVSVLIQSSQVPNIIAAREEIASEGKISKVTGARIIIFAAIAGITGFLLLIFNHLFITFASIEFTDSIFIWLAFFGLSLKLFMEALFLGQDKKLHYGLFEGAFGLIAFIYFTFLLISETNSISHLLGTYFIAGVLSTLVFIPYAGFKKFVPLRFSWDQTKKMLFDSRWILIGSVATFFVNWGDNIVLRVFVDIEQIGIYNFGYQFFKASIVAITTITLFYLPQVKDKLNDHRYLVNFYTSKVRRLVLGWSGLAILSALLMPTVLNILFNFKYTEAEFTLRILFIASIFLIQRRMYEPILNASRDFKFLNLTNILLVAINLGLNLILIPFWGINGAAISTTIAYLVIAIIYEIYFHKSIKTKFLTKS